MTLLNPEELLSSANGRSRIFLGRQCKINDNLKDIFLTFKWLASVKHAIIMSILNINFNPLQYFKKYAQVCSLVSVFLLLYLKFPAEILRRKIHSHHLLGSFLPKPRKKTPSL